ncbi:hypothetical protein BJ912DRAFT_1067299 [Pholiota molesta]|nr:hypothetical protein BJ912DRAFT_1067299 [Pholiota molesta]
MAQVKIRRIQDLTDKETDNIVDLCVRAYVDDPAIAAMTGGNRKLYDLLFRSMVRAGGLAGHLYVVENNAGQILSVALWYGPGTVMFGTEEERNAGINELMSKLDNRTLDWWTTTYPQTADEFGKTWLTTPYEDCWWLNLLGTDPNHQRKGYGTLLLDDAVKKIDSPNLLAFCSTSKENADYYTKAGFPTRAFMQMPTPGKSFPMFGHSRQV